MLLRISSGAYQSVRAECRSVSNCSFVPSPQFSSKVSDSNVTVLNVMQIQASPFRLTLCFFRKVDPSFNPPTPPTIHLPLSHFPNQILLVFLFPTVRIFFFTDLTCQLLFLAFQNLSLRFCYGVVRISRRQGFLMFALKLSLSLSARFYQFLQIPKEKVSCIA